jgi:hypothetical protein
MIFDHLCEELCKKKKVSEMVYKLVISLRPPKWRTQLLGFAQIFELKMAACCSVLQSVGQRGKVQVVRVAKSRQKA